MNPLHFKILLTVMFGIGTVAAFVGQVLNFYMFKKGYPVKVKINLTWVLNPVIIYGIWNWL